MGLACYVTNVSYFEFDSEATIYYTYYNWCFTLSTWTYIGSMMKSDLRSNGSFDEIDCQAFDKNHYFCNITLFTFVVIRVRIRDMIFSNRTHFYLTGKWATSGIAYENMFTLVIKHVRNRIVADLIDSYDECEPGLYK